jgi:hypothetical protein
MLKLISNIAHCDSRTSLCIHIVQRHASVRTLLLGLAEILHQSFKLRVVFELLLRHLDQALDDVLGQLKVGRQVFELGADGPVLNFIEAHHGRIELDMVRPLDL